MTLLISNHGYPGWKVGGKEGKVLSSGEIEDQTHMIYCWVYMLYFYVIQFHKIETIIISILQN